MSAYSRNANKSHHAYAQSMQNSIDAHIASLVRGLPIPVDKKRQDTRRRIEEARIMREENER